eukprot:TRINITY_DN36266_c0_g1_i3.p2 TRINITY_DN36266_c0_g1~~TRINITY_DN36266_c0_g1_i3.p2  ORF type:complete len:317 (+),score=56.73 TRINITY_DN36266_c0_g1_i3:982-1932(+)
MRRARSAEVAASRNCGLLVGDGTYLTVERTHAWEEVPVDFVVAGFAKCGTSTVAANLQQHADIEMARCSDMQVCEHMLWSNERQLDHMLTASVLEGMKHDFGQPGKNPLGLRGIKDSRILTEPTERAMQRMASIPGLKVVVMVRDPVDALESDYNAAQCWRVEAVESIARSGRSDCLQSTAFGSWAERLEALLEFLPRERLSIAHLDAFSDTANGLHAYNSLLQFLGLPEDRLFKPGQQLLEANSRHGERVVDFCAARLATSLQLLKAKAAVEYERLIPMLAAAGQPIQRRCLEDNASFEVLRILCFASNTHAALA